MTSRTVRVTGLIDDGTDSRLTAEADLGMFSMFGQTEVPQKGCLSVCLSVHPRRLSQMYCG